jgi:hypothetical protein
MGLFTSVIHVWHRNARAIEAGLGSVLSGYGFSRMAQEPVLMSGPQRKPGSAVTYAVGPLRGDWATVVEVDIADPGNPSHSEVGNRLSKALNTYVLSLTVHDDDVLLYDLDHVGIQRDGYNSNLQYFEQERIIESYIEEQRHTPDVFAPLLPRGVTVGELQDLLQRGWWAAHDTGDLDDDGVPNDIDAGLVFEGERLVEIGNLLRLHGAPSGYPYAAWAEAPARAWKASRRSRSRPPNNALQRTRFARR